MDAQALLNQLLESGRKLAEQGLTQGSELAGKGKAMAQDGLNYASEKLNIPEAGPERDQMLKNLGIGAAAGGVLALLLGTKSGRGVLKPAVKLGSLAALGALGYKVYGEWQKSQGQSANGQPIANLTGDAANHRSLTIVSAMIAAAKADGTVDGSEQALIAQRLRSSELHDSATEVLLAEIAKPLDISEVAAAADSPESAVEIYLASLLVVDQQNAAEQAYLAKLAAALELSPELVNRLQAEAFDGGAKAEGAS